MNKLLLYFSILLLSKSAFSQHKFLINENLNHHLNIAYMAEESENAYHVIGLTIDTDSSRQSPFVLDIDKGGIYDISNIEIYRNENFLMTMNANNKTIKNGEEIIFHSSYFDEVHVFSYKPNLQKLELRDSFFMDFENETSINDIHLYKSAYLLSGHESSDGTQSKIQKDILINTDSQPIDTISFYNFNLVNDCRRLFANEDSTFTSIMRFLIDEDYFIRILEFDNNLNKIQSYDSDVDNFDVSDAIKDSDGNFIISTFSVMLIDSTSEIPWAYHTPFLIKMSPKAETIWRKSMGTHYKNLFRFSNITSIDESKDGYVIAGADFDSRGFRGHDAVIGKFSNDGDSLWYRRYTTLDRTKESLFNAFNDVIATEDGGYLAVGQQTYFDTLENRDNTSLLIVKTDSLGLIAPDSTSTIVNIIDIPEYTIFPNPTSNRLFVNMQSTEDWQLTLVDLHGKKVLERDLEKNSISYLLDLANYPDGTYILHFNNGQSTFSEKIIINH